MRVYSLNLNFSPKKGINVPFFFLGEKNPTTDNPLLKAAEELLTLKTARKSGDEIRLFSLFFWQVLVWHTRTERPVLVNEGKKGFTDFSVEI